MFGIFVTANADGSIQVIDVRGSALMRVTIKEQGNGFPSTGDYVQDHDGNLYLVLSTEGTIHTGHPGTANWIYAIVEEADWDDCPEGCEHSAMVCPCADDAEGDAR